MQEQRADTQSPIAERRPPTLLTEEPDEPDEPLENLQALLSAETNSAALAQSLGRGSRATHADSWLPLDQDSHPLSAVAAGGLAKQTEISAAALTEPRNGTYDINTAGAKDLLSRLLDDINDSSTSLTREGLISVLERLSEDVNARPSREVTLKEKQGVFGYLEFLEGYFENRDTASGPSKQIALLMEKIRVQLGAVTDPTLAVGMQNLVVASQADSTTQPFAINREQRKKQEKSISVRSEEAQRSDLDSYASVAMMNSIDAGLSAASKKESSQSKDLQRRRDETLVSVTLRSV